MREQRVRAEAAPPTLVQIVPKRIGAGGDQVGRLAQIASSAKQISTLNAENKDIEGQKETLEVMLSMQQNLTRIRNEAINKCEMTYPTEDQIRVVSLMGSGSDPLTQTASTSQEAKPAD